MGRSISRRMFLRGVGGTSLAIPFLPSLLPRRAWAQTQPSTIRRYFNYVGGLDYGHHQHWYPTLNELSHIETPANGDESFRYQSLQSLLRNQNNGVSLILGRELNPYLSRMNLFRGLNLHSRIAHGRGHMLGNINATDGHDSEVVKLKALQTIDQVLASNRRFTPHQNDPLIVAKNKSYSFGADNFGSITLQDESASSPSRLFNRVFQPFGQPIPENGSEQNLDNPRRDLLSLVLNDYKKVIGGRNISSNDKIILNNSMDRIADIQRELAGIRTSQGCYYSQIKPTRATDTKVDSFYYYHVIDHKKLYRLFAQIFAAAAACDVHRVFDFHFGVGTGFDVHPTESFHHGHSHRPWEYIVDPQTPNHQYMAQIYKYNVQAFLAPLLGFLDETIESNGRSILDNSLVHMTIESSTVHSDWNKACLLIGSAGGNLTTGHYIDYSRRELGPHPSQGDGLSADPTNQRFGHVYYGAHYNRSLTTILQAMGLRPDEYEDPSINDFFTNRTDNKIGEHNKGIARVGGYGHIGSPQGKDANRTTTLHNREYSRYNYHYYKDPLPMPKRSAS